MSETNTYTGDFNNVFKERLKILAFLAVGFLIAWLINNVLWTLDKIVVTSIITLLVPLKLFVIIFVFGRVWLLEKKKVFWLLIPLMLIVAFIEDIATVPESWAYSFGTETQGRAVEFTIKSRNSHFITYEFSVDNLLYRKEQEVSIPFYEGLVTNELVAVKYLPNSPKISFLVDTEQLKFQTLLSLFIGYGIILLLVVSKMEEKTASIMNKAFRSRTPA